MEDLIFKNIITYVIIFAIVEGILGFLNWLLFRNNKLVYLRCYYFIGGATFGFLLTLLIIFKIFDSYGLIYYR
ncbi:hypothetical protein [Fusobacterium polymorphum]|uniref:hypothetical protein n=1 Tax=Fusobacterium nucleatum subsp. polymorphum TaxID=76857 RepID=UPI000C1B34D3|nr:hypothetical protein [Fusobacterium polymorphum]PIM75703.1 hypothetical protein CTM65_06780 [Fusobacterium polymorphum]